jgi:hypothetical protein
MRGIGRLDQDVMRTQRQKLDDQRLAASIYPVPGRIVKGNVEVADPRRHAERRGAVDGNDAKVVSPILDYYEPTRKFVGKRSSDNETR